MRRNPGTGSIRIFCRLPFNPVARMLTAVVLPPGRASEFTSPDRPSRRKPRGSEALSLPLCSANYGIPDGIIDIDMTFD
jgi:hypothetical protein